MKKLNAWYIVGLVDGEGCFSYATIKGEKIPVFNITNTHKEVLLRLKEILNLNANVNFAKRYKNPFKHDCNFKPLYVISPRGFDDITKIINFFDKYPPIIKKEQYKQFKHRYNNWKRNHNPPKKYSQETKNKVCELYLQGYKLKTIAYETNLSRGTIGRFIKNIQNRYKKN